MYPMTVIRDEAGNKWFKQEEREHRLNHGVAGVHLTIPFQCETCWMRNLEGRDPEPGLDDLYVSHLRRANLDAMAGKSKNTIMTHRRLIHRMLRDAIEIRKTPSILPRGPFPLDDLVGMSLAVDELHYSITGIGRINDHVQFDTIRKLRSAFGKLWESSPRGAREGASFAKGTGRVRPTSCPSQSEWFREFSSGCEYRMGYETMADHGVSIVAIVNVLDFIRRDAETAEFLGDEEEANELWKIGAFVCIVTAGSLRGYEGFFTDLAGLVENLNKGRDGEIPDGAMKKILTEAECLTLPHVCLCLLGDFKGEGGTNYHMMNLANKSISGLEVRWWIEQLVDVCKVEGRLSGPAFATPGGKLASMGDYNSVFKSYLKEVQSTTELNLIPEGNNVDEMYNLNRTPRKSALTRAKRAQLDKSLQDEMNRWRTVENARGKKVRFNMNDHYSEACLLMPRTWMYVYAL